MTTRRLATTRTDYALLLSVVVLVIAGLIMVYSATFALGDDPLHYLKLQALWAAMGFAVMLFMAQMDYRVWQRLALPIMGVAVLSLLAVLFMGHTVNNAQSWLLKRSVQPSEFTKLAFIIYIAAWLASKGEKIRDVTYGLVPFAVLLGSVTGLILLQPDLGTGVLIVVTAVSMFFIAGAEISQLVIGLLTGGPALATVIMNSSHGRERIQVFLHPGSEPQGAGYQVQGILAALRAGGLFGRGLGASTQKFVQPWVHHTDTIFPLIGEELGFIGCVVLIGLFLFIAYRCLLVSFRAPDNFGALLALGVTCWITCQAIIHVGVNTATLPFTGLTLPFVSYGGSSLVTCMAGVGVLLSISRVGREREIRSVAAFAFGRRDRRPRLSRTRRG